MGKSEKADGIKESTVVKRQICNIAQGDYTKEALEDMNGVYDSIVSGGGRFIISHFTPFRMTNIGVCKRAGTFL